VTRPVLAFLILAAAVPAAAQTPAPPRRVEFVPRVAFHLAAEQLFGVEEDKRLRWDTNFGGELDLVDYGAGRLTFFTNYQAVLGVELRRFDPNQGNYILEGALSARLPHVELAGVFYHQSRHLIDRPKEFPIDWNMLGVRARSTFLLGPVHMDARADVRGVVQHSYVDYRWEVDGRVRGDRLLRPGVGVMFAGSLRHLGVDGTRERGGQTGVRGEGGVRFEGGAGAIELFLAAERRIDPYPLEFGTASWVSAGFRLLSR
jgi:hypothetical protein